MSGAGRPALEMVDAPELTLAILGTRWHADITDSLIERAAAAAVACGIDDPLVLRVAGGSSCRWSRPSWPATTTRWSASAR